MIEGIEKRLGYLLSKSVTAKPAESKFDPYIGVDSSRAWVTAKYRC
jgi:hypothetical protein